MWIDVVIQWIKAFFGTVVFWTGIAGFLLVVVTMIRCRIRGKKAEETLGKPSGQIAMITGASSGIGRAFALRIDQTEANIDEIWLVARRQEKLEALGKELKHPVRIIVTDLTEGLEQEEYENCLTKALKACKEENSSFQVGILVNAAGFAKIGNYKKVSFSDSMRMIDLNAKAVVAVTQTCLAYMEQGARIIQMCSTAAFQPLQHINIYGASKAFLYHYSRALRMELLPRGIIVTSVCPFWVKDTEFIGIAKSGEENERPPIRHFPFATTAEAVARRGLRASRQGWAVVTPGAFCVIHRIFTKLLPREAAIWIWELMRRA